MLQARGYRDVSLAATGWRQWQNRTLKLGGEAMSPEKPHSGGRFARRGLVTATQLTHATVWRTASGDELESRAGDWWVRSSGGEERGVAASEFHHLYELVSGDQYRRIGEVSARPARTGEVIQSLEGPTEADDGSWVVTDPRGNSWVVPGAVFRREYSEAVRESDPGADERPEVRDSRHHQSG